MADFVLTIPDTEVTRVTNALCSDFNLGINNGASGNPATTVEAKQTIINIIQQIVVAVEAAAAANSIVPPTMQ